MKESKQLTWEFDNFFGNVTKKVRACYEDGKLTGLSISHTNGSLIFLDRVEMLAVEAIIKQIKEI